MAWRSLLRDYEDAALRLKFGSCGTMDPPRFTIRDLPSAFLKGSFYAQGLRAGGEALFVVSQLGGEEIYGGFADGCCWVDYASKVCRIV